MIKIKVSVPLNYIEHHRRMIPNDGVIDNVKFYFDNEPLEYDYWLIIHVSGLERVETAICAKDRIIYASLEADETISQACKKFLDQFHYAFSCDSTIDIPHRINLSLHGWWVGIKVKFEKGKHIISKDCSMNYFSLGQPLATKKQDRISVILSNKDSLPGHRERKTFIEKLISSRVGKYIDIYGPDAMPVEDKWDALVGYKYHLCIENMVKNNYFTEKLADPLLAECLCFYVGCPNISDYLPANSLLHMSYQDEFEKTVSLIESALESDLYDESLEAIRLGKQEILNKNNLFFIIARRFNKPKIKKVAITLYPSSLLKNPLRYMTKKLLALLGIS